MNTIEYYVSLPWTVQPEVRDDDGRYIALRIAELPGFVVTGADDTEVNANFWPALRAFIESYIDEGEEPPMPLPAASTTTYWSPEDDYTAFSSFGHTAAV